MKKKIVVAFCISMMCATTILSGCSSKEEKQSEKKIEVEKKEELKTIGTEEKATFKVTLKNSTKKEITGVSVKLTDDEAYPENMLKSGDTFKAEESRILCYTKPESKTAEESQKTDSKDEKVLEQGYDIQLTFADNTTAELHSFPFEDIEEGEVLYSDDVAYITYTSVKTKEKMDTKEAELAVKAQVEAAQKAAEEEAAKKAAEEEAAKKAAEEEAQKASSASTYSEPESSYNEPEPSYSEPEPSYSEPEPSYSEPEPTPSPDTGSSDGCIDDGLVY